MKGSFKEYTFWWVTRLRVDDLDSCFLRSPADCRELDRMKSFAANPCSVNEWEKIYGSSPEVR